MFLLTQSRFERRSFRLDGQSGLTIKPRVSELSFSLKAVLTWFEQVLATLDCYTWVFGHDLLDPVSLLTGRLSPVEKMVDIVM